MTPRVLVAGIGNIFLGDDGFGPEVMRQLPERHTDSGVRIIDYGIRGMHLAYDLLEEWDGLILVDALPDRGSPGTVHVFEADHHNLCTTNLRTPSGLDAHSMDPVAVFASLRALGGSAPRTVVIGCEVADISDGIGLSQPVEAAVTEAVHAVESALALLQAESVQRK